MFKQIKTFFKHSVIYGISNLLTKAVAVVLVPLYTRFLTPGDYGYLELLAITASFLLIIQQMGMGAALFRSVLYKPNSDESLLISMAFFFMMISSFLCFLILFFFSPSISSLLLDTGEGELLLKMVFLTVFLNVFSTVPLVYLRMKNQSLKFSIIACIGFVIELSLNIFFVAGLKMGIKGIVISGLIKSAIFALIYVAIIRKSLAFRFSFTELKDMLGFALPMVPSGIALSVLSISNRYFLKYYCTMEEVGIFTLGYRIGMIMSLIVNSIQIAWPSIMFSVARGEQPKRTYARIFTFYLLVVSFIGLSLSIFAFEIVRILGTVAYQDAYRIVPVIVISYIFMGIYYLTSVGINLKKKTKYEPFIVGTAAISNLVLNYLLIPLYGMKGAAVASLCSFIIMAILEWSISARFYLIHYEYVRLGKLILINCAIFVLSTLIAQDNFFYAVTLKLLLLIAFPFFLFAIKFFEPVEIEKFKQIINQKLFAKLRSMH